jgi:hypothetical protein
MSDNIGHRLKAMRGLCFARHRFTRAGGVVGRVNRHLGQPEVEQFRAVARHHDVGRLQIAMEDAFAVCDVQRVHDLRGHAQRLVEG